MFQTMFNGRPMICDVWPPMAITVSCHPLANHGLKGEPINLWSVVASSSKGWVGGCYQKGDISIIHGLNVNDLWRDDWQCQCPSRWTNEQQKVVGQKHHDLIRQRKGHHCCPKHPNLCHTFTSLTMTPHQAYLLTAMMAHSTCLIECWWLKSQVAKQPRVVGIVGLQPFQGEFINVQSHV